MALRKALKRSGAALRGFGVVFIRLRVTLQPRSNLLLTLTFNPITKVLRVFFCPLKSPTCSQRRQPSSRCAPTTTAHEPHTGGGCFAPSRCYLRSARFACGVIKKGGVPATWPGHQRGRDSGCGNRERFRLCLWLRSMPGKVPQILGLVERLPVAGATKGGEIPAMPVAGPSRWGVGLCRYGAGLPPTKQAQRVSGGLAAT